jgi:hypothetical protein
MLGFVAGGAGRQILFFTTELHRKAGERGLTVEQFKVEYRFPQAVRARRFDFFDAVG